MQVLSVETEQSNMAMVVETAPDGIFSVDGNHIVRSWNPAMERITGVGHQAALGHHVSQSFRPADEASSPEDGIPGDGIPGHGAPGPARRAAPTGPVAVSIKVGDDQRWLSCSYALLADGGYVVIVRDDTKQKKLQDDEDFWIAQVSHELLTPLTPIKGFLQTLSRGDIGLSPAERVDIYAIMLREAERLEDLVASLVRSTVRQPDGPVAHAAVLDWAETVRHQARLAGGGDPSRTISFRVNGPHPRVNADETVAVTVVANLLSNAVKYTAAGTPIEIDIETRPGEVTTTIVDHGPGIAGADHERIFERFTRLDDHLNRGQPGVGLGLHIARRSVDALGGRIWIESTPGGGATFRFTLPAVPEPPTNANGRTEPRERTPTAR